MRLGGVRTEALDELVSMLACATHKVARPVMQSQAVSQSTTSTTCHVLRTVASLWLLFLLFLLLLLQVC